VPNKIDARTFPSMSSQLSSQLLSGLRFLELIDADGTPDPLLITLATKEGSRKEILKGLIETHYPEIIALDLAKITPKQLDDTLTEHYGVQGETTKKAKTFLLKAAQYAGYTVHPLLTKITRNRKGGKRATGKMERGGSGIQIHPEIKPPRDSVGTEKTIQLRNGGTVTLSLDVNILELKGEDRKFVFGLIDTLDTFENSLPLPE